MKFIWYRFDNGKKARGPNSRLVQQSIEKGRLMFCADETKHSARSDRLQEFVQQDTGLKILKIIEAFSDLEDLRYLIPASRSSARLAARAQGASHI